MSRTRTTIALAAAFVVTNIARVVEARLQARTCNKAWHRGGPKASLNRAGNRIGDPVVRAAARRTPIAHASNIVQCDGPNSPHAFDIIPLQPRNGTLDAECPICKGHGQWNTEIDLVSFRCKRAICDYCHGAGWIETGNDPVGHADIVMSPNGYPQWIVAFEPRQNTEHTVADPTAPLSPERFDR